MEGSFVSIDAAASAFERTHAETERALGIRVTAEKMILAEYGASRFRSDIAQPSP